MTRIDMYIALGRVSLPNINQVNLRYKEDTTPAYAPLLKEIGATTKEEIIELRDIIMDRINDMQQEALMQSVIDLIVGEDDETEEQPMHYHITPYGQVVTAIPIEIGNWIGFMEWLSAYIDAL